MRRGFLHCVPGDRTDVFECGTWCDLVVNISGIDRERTAARDTGSVHFIIFANSVRFDDAC